MKKTIALKDADKYNNISSEDLDRILPQMSMRDSIKKWEDIIDPQIEEEFEEDLPVSDVPNTGPESFVEETSYESMPEEPVEFEKDQFGNLVRDSKGNIILLPSQPNVHEDEAFNKYLSLPIDELKELAQAFAEDYGYDKGFNDEGQYNGYIAPASAKLRSEAKGILSRIYDVVIEKGKASARQSNKGEFELKKQNELKIQMKEIDKLNDLEVRHAITYYKKLKMADDKASKKIQTQQENLEEEVAA